MPENEIIPTPDAPETAPIETAKEKFERERLTRRQALKRFGMTSAMAAFALLSVDDLAHMVGKAMQQRAGDNKVAEQIAKEFQEAGIARASGPSTSCGYSCQFCGSVFARETGNVQDCQQACSDCCTPSFFNWYPCGVHADAVVTACHDECQQFFHSGV